MLKFLAFCIVAVLLVSIPAIAFGELRTWQLENSGPQELFLAGQIPSPSPNGFYQGSVNTYAGSWAGKSFDATTSAGINVFTNTPGKKSDGTASTDSLGTDSTPFTKQYPFKTYLGKGLRDKNLDVLKIDYDIPENPFWLRMITDEIVEIDAGHYIGKMQLRAVPGLPFTLTFFELRKPTAASSDNPEGADVPKNADNIGQ